jgi:integrase
VRFLLSKMYAVGIDSRWCETNPALGTRAPTFEPRTRYLRQGEVAAFLVAVDQLVSRTARDYILLCLHTGARRSNVGSMRWDELDMADALWTIPAAKLKRKKPQTIPLSNHAMEIIQARAGNGSEWVLPGRSRDGCYTEPKSAWRQVLKNSGLESLTIHDLRRTVGAWQLRGGASLRVVAESLGHSSVQVTAKHYQPMEHDLVRASVTTAMDAMLKAGGSR